MKIKVYNSNFKNFIFKKFSIITYHFIKNVSMCIIIYEIVSYEIDCQILKFVFAAVKFNENALQKSVFKKIYIILISNHV